MNDLVVYREWTDKHGLRRLEKLGPLADEIARFHTNLDRIKREAESQIRGSTHYEGCASHHPYCRILAFVQDALRPSPPYHEDISDEQQPSH